MRVSPRFIEAVLESGSNDGHVPVAPREIGANQRAEREQMRAVLRLWRVLLAGALALAPAIALAQQAPSSGGNTPATDAIGPKDLQSFSLNGTVTRAADQPAAATPAPQRRSPRTQAQTSSPPSQSASSPLASQTQSVPAQRPTRAASTEPSRTQPSPPAATTQRAPVALRSPPPSSSVTVALPSLDKASSGAAGAAATPQATDFAPGPTTGTLAPEHKFPVIPWLLAALALGAGGAFLFWRNRSREALAGAGGAQVDAFVAPEPAPVPRRAPVPTPPAPKPPAPASLGVVSTRLRPWVEIAFQPLRCILETERVMVEFELELFNSGSGPARAVLAEATLFNAGPVQDQEIGAFFANPVGEGERIVVIPPLKRVAIKTQVAVPSDRIQAYELAGRQVFVPVIAFNVLYNWSGGEGQTSVSYLLGRDTKGEKMGPFRLDLGPRIFRGITGRLLPNGVRT